MAFNGNKAWTSAEDEMLQTLARQGKTYSQIANAMGRTERAISNRVWWKNKKAKENDEKSCTEIRATTEHSESIDTESTLGVAKETAYRLGCGCIARIEYRISETQESATVRATDDSGNAISVVIIKSGKEGAK